MTGREIVNLFKETVAEWTEDKAPRLGAALAYYAAFSVAPVLIIAIVIAGSVLGDRADVQHRIVAQIATVIGPEGAGLIDRMIERAYLPRDAGIVTTGVGVVTLLLGALGAFGQLQDAFDTIWEVAPKPRRGLVPFIQTRLISFAMVLAVGFLLLVTLIVNAVIAAVGEHLVLCVPNFALISTVVNLLLPFVVITLLFAVMFKVLPDVDLAWRDVWPGAILTSLLFTIGKYALGLYLGNSRLGTVYGAAGSLLIVLIWIYYSAQILYFGAEFTQVYIKRYGHRRAVPTENAVPLTEAARAQQGMPRPETVEAEAQALDGAAAPVGSGHFRGKGRADRVARPGRPAPATPGYTHMLLGFAAGLGAGAVMALRTMRNGRIRRR